MTNPRPDALARLRDALAGRYAIREELGAGGMATVYLAHDVKHDRKVALKVLRPELAAVIGADRFLQEIKTTANLQHPHILALHDSGEVDGTVFYVMPFVEGESLRDRLNREKQLPVADAVRIATEVAGALAYAHDKGVIHRDIKPENILLHAGQALVADFGIALAAANTGGTRMTETGMSLGTPHYMSPEQAMGERDLDARTDVYALGCVVYEMLTGEPPFDGPTAQAILARVMSSEPQPVTQLRKTVPPNVVAVVHTAIQKLPADRFASAAALANALTDPGFAAATVSGTKRGMSGTPTRWAGALMGAAVVGFAAAWLIKDGGAADGVKSDRVYRFEVPPPPGYTPSLGMSLLPDGSGTVFIGDGAEGHGIALTSFAGGPTKFLPAPDASVGAFFDPVLAGVVYYTFPVEDFQRGIVAKVAPISGAPPRIWTDSLRGPMDVDDAGWLYGSHRDSSGITRVDPSGRTIEVLTRPDRASGEQRHWVGKLLPGDRAVSFDIYYRDDRHPRLGFIDLTTGAVYRRTEGLNATMLPNGYMVFGRAHGLGGFLSVRDDGTIFAARFDLATLVFEHTPVPVLEGPSRFSVSEGGDLLYREPPSPRWQVHRMTSGGSTVVMTAEGEPLSDMRQHPVDTDIVTLEGTTDLWVRSPDRRARRLPLPTRNRRLVGWSPNGSRIMYVEPDGPRGGPNEPGTLYTIRADGVGSPTPLGRGTGGAVFGADWGRGGIAYQTTTTGPDFVNNVTVLWWLPEGSQDPVQVGTVGRGPAQAAVSPDGRFVAYVVGSARLMVAAVPPGEGVWEIGNGTVPRWSPDGRYLYFDAERLPYDDTPLPVMRVPVTLGETFVFGEPEVGAEPPAGATLKWDVGNDGAVYWVTQPDPRPWVLVVNWAHVVDSLVRAARGGAP